MFVQDYWFARMRYADLVYKDARAMALWLRGKPATVTRGTVSLSIEQPRASALV